LTFLGHMTSSVTRPYDTAHAISYRCPVVTKSLSGAVFEIMGLKDLDLSRSRDVTTDVIIRSAIGHFLLVGNWYQASISNRFRYICI